ncbi:hypothetical protein [Pseudonocardia alaniniphila]|uniref:DUF4345 domain-containing protein n=1 Tax=Pseudonocardia alaniniphila TaxID=75291 RepID=A0ABS9TRK8_9PSEU|nr:hypothetical protein [Pseudonocardia alaniniphila]MCH6171177.1 hypothetical protein [Pseudonocardia alaniniphila]
MLKPKLTTLTAADWTVAASGVLALAMGIAGLAGPERQVRALGFEGSDGDRDHLTAVLTSTSAAAVNNGFLYLIGVATGSSWFPAYTVAARAVMGGVLGARVATGRAPRSFIAAALWEVLGAAATAGALWWDGRRSRRRGGGSGQPPLPLLDDQRE